jgi:hypothetical protein
MDKQQAWNLMTQVCANYRGTIEEHKALQQALEVLKPEVKKDEVKPA